MKTINSLELATMLSRTHGEVLKMIKGTSGKKGAIENLQVQGIQNIEDYFIESNYKGKLLCYEVTEKGCEILASKIGHSRRNPELTKESFLDSCTNYFNELEQQQTDDSGESTHTNNSLVSVFDNEEFGKIRTLVINDEPWFIGRDIINSLGYDLNNHSYTRYINQYCSKEDIKKLNNPDAGLFGIKNAGRKGETLINEYALYDLIFESPLPQAKEFKKWVTHEVLPQIRKNNAYSVSFSDKDILLKAVDIVDVKIKEKKDELNKLEQSRSIFNILID